MALLIGSSACSMRSRIDILFSTGCCCPPSARSRAPSTELGVTTAAPKARTAITTVTNTTTTKIRGSIPKPVYLNLFYLNLDPDDLADHEISNGLQSDPGDQQHVSDRVREERANESRIQYQHDRDDNGRHPHQQRHGEASLGGIDAHLALNFETLADNVRQVV